MNLGHEQRDFVSVSDIKIPKTFYSRLKTDIDEIDSIFGCGILPGSSITLTAKGGAGKTVFCLTLGELLVDKGYKVAYSSGEENSFQLAYNSERLNVKNLKVGTMTDADMLLERMKDYDLLIVDSFQSLTTSRKLNTRAKSQYFIDNLVKKAKDVNCAIIFIVQLNIDGTMKGGTTLSHSVDVNIKMETLPKIGL